MSGGGKIMEPKKRSSILAILWPGFMLIVWAIVLFYSFQGPGSNFVGVDGRLHYDLWLSQLLFPTVIAFGIGVASGALLYYRKPFDSIQSAVTRKVAGGVCVFLGIILFLSGVLFVLWAFAKLATQ
jgi:hypothetical protein